MYWVVSELSKNEVSACACTNELTSSHSNIRAIQSLNERELREGGDTASWHADYAHSAYIYIGGLPYHLSEGDIVVVFSQWGEIVDLNLQRDRETGKSRGFAFLAYEDQRSTVLAVDNMNGTTLVGRTLRVDHVKDYRAARVPKNETEEQRDARVKAERAMRLRVLPWHLMDEDERIEAARDGVLVEKGVGVGVRASAELLADNDRDALDELDDDERRRREFELDDPMREYLKSIDESNEGEVPGKKKKKKDSSAKKTKKATLRVPKMSESWSNLSRKVMAYTRSDHILLLMSKVIFTKKAAFPVLRIMIVERT
ncbi:hypothetical protein HDU82_005694 [Entophlyctis luteolus]|nr:hypothetical protein HDU82_005694 [Entophlyctis luteolus]